MTLDIDFSKYENGLVPVVVQSKSTGQVLMLGFASEEAVMKTLETRIAHFFSRSRQSLWRKGESSGDTLKVLKVLTDCDNDSLLYMVEVEGNGVCHKKDHFSCFEYELTKSGVQDTHGENSFTLFSEEENMILAKQKEDSSHSVTADSLKKPLARIAQKFGEEAIEVVCALLDASQKEKIASEVADLMYRLQIALVKVGISWSEVESEIIRRRK